MRFLVAICFAAMAASTAAAPAGADDLTSAQKAAIDKEIHDYLLSHPEVLIEAVQAADDKVKADAHDKAQQALAEKRKQVFDDPSSPVGGDPHGDVTLVEFFDYRCPYCKEVEPSLEKVLADDHHLRFVYKEFPVLGPVSTTAARAALAARKQGKYDAFHRAMMAAKGQISDQTVMDIAGSVGLDIGQLQRDMASPDVDKTLKADMALADALDISGTPAFIIGNTIIPGAVDLDALKQAIADARKKG
jgi:protein-disulfide isomerase